MPLMTVLLLFPYGSGHRDVRHPSCGIVWWRSARGACDAASRVAILTARGQRMDERRMHRTLRPRDARLRSERYVCRPSVAATRRPASGHLHEVLWHEWPAFREGLEGA